MGAPHAVFLAVLLLSCIPDFSEGFSSSYLLRVGREGVNAPFRHSTCPRIGPQSAGRRQRAFSQLIMQEDRDPANREERFELENELKDSQGWLGYTFPRPVRKVAWAAIGANSLWGAFIVLGSPTQTGASPFDAAVTNLAGAVAFFALLAWEFTDEQRRKSFRQNLRQKQIAIGDREVYQKVDEASGEVRTFSKLKPVDDDWIIRRIDRWGVVETATTGGNPLPTVGPAKGALLEQLVAQHQPKLIVDVGSFVGYAAIRMARRQPSGGLTVTLEKEFRWHAAARRFVWQAKLWQQYPWEPNPERRVDCLLGDALDLMPLVREKHGQADMLLIDAKVSEYREYLRVAEDCGLLKDGTIVVADNAALFKDFDGMRDYLARVRESGLYETRTLKTTLEYRDDTPDAMEVSVFRPAGVVPATTSSEGSERSATGS